MDRIDKQILSEIQENFPISKSPFAEIGSKLDLQEKEVIKRIERMKKRGLIRRIGAVMNSGKLGYKTMLAAMSVADRHLEMTVNVINDYAEITHNYLRDNKLNLWFTITAPSHPRIKQIVDEIKLKTGQQQVYLFEAERMFKIKAVFNLD
ncbi:MAG: AsnC family transcriptional regulator [Fidelibacterota bacterium]